jgi:uncharacterized membrane protein
MKLGFNIDGKEYLHRLQLFVLFLLAFVAIAFTGFDAFANAMSDAVNDIKTEADDVVAPLGKLAILLLGIGAVFGRISIMQALVVGTGIAIATDPGGILNLVEGSVGGTAGKAYVVANRIVEPVGVLGIIVVGIAAIFGRISMTQALVVAIGIAVATGSSEIYGDLQR